MEFRRWYRHHSYVCSGMHEFEELFLKLFVDNLLFLFFSLLIDSLYCISFLAIFLRCLNGTIYNQIISAMWRIIKKLNVIKKTTRSKLINHIIAEKSCLCSFKNILAPIMACQIARATRVNIHTIAYISIDVKYEIVG
jgi:hypothetical protein